MTNSDKPGRRQPNFLPGIDPGSAFVASEFTYEELCERYLNARRDEGAEDIEKAADEGSGELTARPGSSPRPDDERDQTQRRRKPAAR